jgi:hypothetical protein
MFRKDLEWGSSPRTAALLRARTVAWLRLTAIRHEPAPDKLAASNAAFYSKSNAAVQTPFTVLAPYEAAGRTNGAGAWTLVASVF